MSNAIVANGREEAAAANGLCELQAEAEAAVRERYRERLDDARGFRRLVEWLRMHREIRAAKERAGEDVAPRGGLYFQDKAPGEDGHEDGAEQPLPP